MYVAQGAGDTTATAWWATVTSAVYGCTIGKGIAYAWLPAELAASAATVHIGYSSGASRRS